MTLYRVIGARRHFERLVEKYKVEIYRYNEFIKNTGYYLKPVHMVYKRDRDGRLRVYRYVAKYWWRIFYIGRRGKTSRIKWIYVGSRMPYHPDLMLNPPPPSPFEGIGYAVEGEDVLLTDEAYRRVKSLLKGFPVRIIGEQGDA